MIGEERFFDISAADGLTSEELESIKVRADLRRRQFDFKRNVKALVRIDEELSPSIQTRQEAELKLVYKEVDGEVELLEPTEEINAQIARELQNAKEAAVNAPNLAALNYARAAKLQFRIGLDYHDTLAAARVYIDKSKNLPKNSPAALLPEAIVLGIESKLLNNLPEVDLAKAARVVAVDLSLAEDYALVLSEDRREEFMRALPEESRAKISALIDRELSGLLPESLIAGEVEAAQRQKVQERAKEALKKLIENPEDKAERAVARALSQTLMGLEGEDSKRILQELGELSLSRSKEPSKARAKISYAARVLQTLSDIDRAKGGVLTMKFLGKKEVPEKFFTFFGKRLIQDGFLTKNAEKYLRDKNNLSFLRKLVAQYPNQFNTVVDTLSQLRDYKIQSNEQEIFGAIKDLETLTPIIFDRYRRADSAGKKELAQSIRELKPKFFRNVPVKDILPKGDRDILVEMIYLSYKPIGMSFERIKELVGQLKDRTADLRDYKFPLEGYEFALTSKKTFVPREGERIDMAKIGHLREMLAGSYPEKDDEIKKGSLLLGRLAKAGTDFKSEELQSVLGLMARDEQIVNFLRRYPKVEERNVYGFLSELKEISGIYFKDNFSERLANFLGANPTIAAAMAKILANPERIKTLKSKLGKDGEGVDWEILAHLEISREADRAKVGELFSKLVLTKVLKSAREEIAKNVNKFEEREGGEAVSATSSELKAYISKNIGSFFAKASAGICTAQDIPLFNRDDHFHINIVEGESQVRGNIQAYIIKDDGGRSLVLRGFNPNADFLEKIEPGAFAEKVMEIGRSFARENNLRKVYITEQGGWHALSNREKIARYLSKYLKEAKKKPFALQVSSGTSIGSIYEV